MFDKIEVLKSTEHQSLRFAKTDSYLFSKKLTSVKISLSELHLASRYYPIVFFENAPCLPQALLSLEKNKNCFVAADGRWMVSYVPFYLRFYPFTLLRNQADSKKFSLCMDPEAEHFKSNMGEPLFTADGSLSEFLKNSILRPLEAYHRELTVTENIFSALDQLGLIVNQAFKFRQGSRERSIDGFRGVDMTKLQELDDKRLANMVKNNTLPRVYDHINSLENFNLLLSSTHGRPSRS